MGIVYCTKNEAAVSAVVCVWTGYKSSHCQLSSSREDVSLIERQSVLIFFRFHQIVSVVTFPYSLAYVLIEHISSLRCRPSRKVFLYARVYTVG